MTEPRVNHDLRRRARAHTRGVLEADGIPTRTKFIVDPATGDLLFPCARDAAKADELVLWVPDDGFESLQLLLSARTIDAGDAALMRHAAYHGVMHERCWVRAQIESGRDPHGVYDGAELPMNNPFVGVQTALCARLNADRGRLSTMIELALRVCPVDPVCVGVDELGCDVRASVGVIRVEWPGVARDQAEVEATIDRLLGES